MQYDELFDRSTFNMISEAQHEARSGNKAAVTIYMVAKVFIDRDSVMARRVFGDKNMDMNAFRRLAVVRINEMPVVPDVTPFVDDELDRMVRSAIRRDCSGHIVAGSVSAESLLQSIVLQHGEEYRQFVQEEETSSRSSSSSSNNILEQYCDDWTEHADRGELQPVIGRDDEIAEIEQVLIQKTKNNVVLTGDAGTGKTAVGEALALKISQGQVPEILRSAKVLSIHFSSLIEREGLSGVKRAIDTVSRSGNTILLIDEIHNLPHPVMEELKAPMARGKIRILGMTTDEEYSRFIETNKAFARRIRRVVVKELSASDTLSVLKHIRSGYESHHGIRIGDDALEAAVSLSQRYITNRCQPDKSIDLVDEAAAKVRMAGRPGPVGEDDIRAVLARKTGIPVERLTTDEVARLSNMEQDLGREVIGQTEAIASVAKTIRRNSVGLTNPNKPVGSFLFNGHSGVGKTKLCQSLAKFLMGEEDALIRLDMSEYQEAHTISRLIGSPPGYVGHQEGGQLTEAVSLHPYSVVLFDEIEKAHTDVYKTLLQVLDHGCLTDGRGRKVDFTNTIVIFTANLVNDMASGRQRIGFDPSGTMGSVSGHGREIRRFFSPEFLNRLDGIIQFNDLGESELLGIARKMLSELKDELNAEGYVVDFDDSVARYIISIDPGFGQGARPIHRAIEQHVTDVLVSKVYEGSLQKGRPVSVYVSDGTVRIRQ